MAHGTRLQSGPGGFWFFVLPVPVYQSWKPEASYKLRKLLTRDALISLEYVTQSILKSVRTAFWDILADFVIIVLLFQRNDFVPFACFIFVGTIGIFGVISPPVYSYWKPFASQKIPKV